MSAQGLQRLSYVLLLALIAYVAVGAGLSAELPSGLPGGM